MRYSDTHKAETRERILKVAAAKLRAEGPEKLSLAEVMKAAGLTHGGFYAHFKSKDALLIETLRHAFARSRQKAFKTVDGLPPLHALDAYIDFYVSPIHRDHPANGCPIAALNSDTPRQSKKFRTAFDEGVNGLTETVSTLLQAAGYDEPENLARSILSAMVGAISLSRSVADKQLSDDLLQAARTGIKARLGLTDAALSRITCHG